MTKPINYPTPEWISAWCETRHCTPEDADMAWWDLEIEKGNPTPYDLDETAEAVSKELRRGKAVDAYGKERKRERKPDEEKRELIRRLVEALADLSPEVVNPEREIRFGSYSVTLTRHRTPKG
jgi:hypothetical protein